MLEESNAVIIPITPDRNMVPTNLRIFIGDIVDIVEDAKFVTTLKDLATNLADYVRRVRRLEKGVTAQID